MSGLTTGALLLHDDLSIEFGRRDLPVRGPDDAVLRVCWAGLDDRDLEVMRTGRHVGTWPATPGRDICGIVEVAPDDGSLRVGESVVVDPRVPCGQCATCLTSGTERCRCAGFLGQEHPGGFAERGVFPASRLHRVPPGLESSTAVLAGPLALVHHGLSRLEADPGPVLILGHGLLGALACLELRHWPSAVDVTVVEASPLRARLALALGARTVAGADDLQDERYTALIDTTGSEQSLRDAFRLSSAGARLLLLASDDSATLPTAELMRRDIQVWGVGTFDDELPEALALLASAPWRYEPLVSDAALLAELPAIATQLSEKLEAVMVAVHP